MKNPIVDKNLQKINIVWTAYNEEFTLKQSVLSLKKAVSYTVRRLNKKYKDFFDGVNSWANS